MVGSSLSEEDQRAWNRVLGIGFVLVVGGSSSLAAFANGGTMIETAGLGMLGLATGSGLLWYLTSLSLSNGVKRERRRR